MRPRRLAPLSLAALLIAGCVAAPLGPVAPLPTVPAPAPSPLAELPAGSDEPAITLAAGARPGGLWAVSGTRELRLSDDRGASWSEVRPVPTADVAGSVWLDARTALVPWTTRVPTGVRVRLQRTADAGRSWDSIDALVFPTDPEDLFRISLHARDATHVILLATRLVRTVGGDGHGHLFARDCLRLRSSDAGRSWAADRDAPCLGEPVVHWSGEAGWMRALRGEGAVGDGLLVSADGGESWTRAELGELPYGYLAIPLLATGDLERLRLLVALRRADGTPAPEHEEAVRTYESRDGGRHWRVAAEATGFGAHLREVVALGAGHWVALGRTPGADPALLETRDAGAHWAQIPTRALPAGGSLRAGGDGILLLAGAGPTYGLWLSADGGRTWRAAPF